mgnify:CR=1 FL=1
MEAIIFIVIIAGIGAYIYGKMPKVRKKPKTLAAKFKEVTFGNN